MELLSSPKASYFSPLAKNYCLALSTALLSAAAFCCLLVSGLSCSFLSVSANQNAVIDPNTTNVPAEDLWYYNEIISEDGNVLSVGILCHGDLDWLAPKTSDDSMRVLSKVFLIVALSLGAPLLIATCCISSFIPASSFVWDGISYVAAGMFVCEMPIFFLLDSPPCSHSKGMFNCQMGSGSYALIASMFCSLSLALLTQWKNPPDWKEEYEIWNLRRRNKQMNLIGLFGGSKTLEENSDEEIAVFNDEEMTTANQKVTQQQQHEEVGLEIQVEKVPSPQRYVRIIGHKDNRYQQQQQNNLMGQYIDLIPTTQSQGSSTTKSSRPNHNHLSLSVATDRVQNITKEQSFPECQFRALGIRPVSPLSTCTGLSVSPRERMSPQESVSPQERTSTPGLSNITDQATFMENAFMDEGDAFVQEYLAKAKTSYDFRTTDDLSVKSALEQSVSSKQSIVSMMRDKLFKSSDDEHVFEDNSTTQIIKAPSTDMRQAQRPSTPVSPDIESDVAGLLVPGMISQMKQQIACKPVVSPERERTKDPEIDMYPSESSVSELSLPNNEDEEYLKRIEEVYLNQKNISAVPTLSIPLNYRSDSSGGSSELDQVIAGVQRINRKTSGKITPFNKRNRRRRGSRSGGGSLSGDSYSSAQGSLLDEVIVEEGENNGNNASFETSNGSGSIPNVITPDKKSGSRVNFADDDDHSGYQHDQSGEEDEAQSVTSSVASARRHRLALNRKSQLEPEGIPSVGYNAGKSALDEFLHTEAGPSTEEKVKLLQDALDHLQKSSTGDDAGYLSSTKSVRSLPALTKVNQRYAPKAQTVELPLNVRNTPHAQDVNTGAAPASDRNHSDSAWQARKSRLKRLRMLRAEEADSSSHDDVIRAKEGIIACASDEGSI